jgi:hypothetical protein
MRDSRLRTGSSSYRRRGRNANNTVATNDFRNEAFDEETDDEGIT